MRQIPRMATYPITIWTLRSQLENGYTLSQTCTRCGKHQGEVDIAGLVAKGFGEKPVRDLQLRCETCKTLLEFTLSPPSRHLKTIPP